MQSSTKILSALVWTLALVQLALSAPQNQIGDEGSPKKSNFFSDLAIRFRRPGCFGGSCVTEDELHEVPSASQPQEHESFSNRFLWKRDAKRKSAVPVEQSRSIEDEVIVNHPLGASSPDHAQEVYRDLDEAFTNFASPISSLGGMGDDDDYYEIVPGAIRNERPAESSTFDGAVQNAANKSLKQKDIDIRESIESEIDEAIKRSIERSMAQHASPDDMAEQFKISAVADILKGEQGELQLSVSDCEFIMHENAQRAIRNPREVLNEEAREDDLENAIELAIEYCHRSSGSSIADEGADAASKALKAAGVHSNPLLEEKIEDSMEPTALEDKNQHHEHKHQNVSEELDEERAENATIDTLDGGIHLSAKEEDKVEAEVEEAAEKAQKAALSENEIAHAARVAAERAIELTSDQEIPHELVEQVEREVEKSISDNKDHEDDHAQDHHGDSNEDEIARQAETGRMRTEDPWR